MVICSRPAQAYREARVQLGERVTTEALAEILANLEAEGLRLVAAKRSSSLLLEATPSAVHSRGMNR